MVTTLSLHQQTIMVSTLNVLLLTLNKALPGGRPRITRFVLMLISLWIMSKAGHWEYLPWWFVDEDSMLSPWQFLLFFLIFYIEQDARTYTNSMTGCELRKRTYFGVLTYLPPHLEFTNLQVYGVQVSFCSCFFIKAYRGVVVGAALMCCRYCLSVILLDPPLERLATKNTRRETIS